jgi:sugar phosphate isomerase/epimerase
MNLNLLPFRLGTSSYIIPEDILPNVRYLGGKVRDVELVLFEVDDGPNNLPTQEVLDEMIQLAGLYDLTYTVHLPLDLKLADDGSSRDVSLVKAKSVIELRQLDPWAYVLHLDGKSVRDSANPDVLRSWQDQAVRALEIAAEWAGGLEKLAVENLEGYPPDFIQPVLDRIPVSRCVDIGHLWLDGTPVLPYLDKACHARVIHLHGIAGAMPPEHIPTAELDAVLQNWSPIIAASYPGNLQRSRFLSSSQPSSTAWRLQSRAYADLHLRWGAQRQECLCPGACP